MRRNQLPAGCPTDSPWGQVQTGIQIAPGWWSVSTASHGGHYVEPERWALMPDYMRQTSYSRGGWFEEDCDWCLPVMVFRREFALFCERHREYHAADYDPLEAAESTFRGWHKERAALFDRGFTAALVMAD